MDVAAVDCAVLVTTHYENLKVLPFENPRFRNGAMGLDPESSRPSYRLDLDSAGASSALKTALRLGLDKAIVERAGALAGPQQAALQRVLEGLEVERAGLVRRNEALEDELTRARHAREKAQVLQSKLDARLKRALSQEESPLFPMVFARCCP